MSESPQHPREPSTGTEPGAAPPRGDPRLVEAWREWLRALATNAEAALSAALLYRGLDESAREDWLDALEQDAGALDVPKVALYAPLLSVEADPVRRRRIHGAIGSLEAATPRVTAEALAGADERGLRVAVLISPLYLDFVQVLACGYAIDRGFEWVRHDPIVDRRNVPRSGERIEGARLESTPRKTLIDELAQAVLAHRRRGRELPEALRVFADLFGPEPDSTALSSSGP